MCPQIKGKPQPTLSPSEFSQETYLPGSKTLASWLFNPICVVGGIVLVSEIYPGMVVRAVIQTTRGLRQGD